MRFPDWVEHPKKDRPAKRLEYIIRQAMLTLSCRTMKDFAALCNIDRTSMHYHIGRGAFSPVMATAIERAVGRNVLKHEDLMNPLDIAAE